MQIEQIAIEELHEYEKNPRIIPETAVQAVADSIKEFGFNSPCLIDAENLIIAGHTRKKAAALLGLAAIPCIRITNLTPAQVRAYRIADNKSGQFSEWDTALLPDELRALMEMDYDLANTLFNKDEIAELLAKSEDGNTDVDTVPPLPMDEPKSKRGCVYVLGNHRLMCGDSGSPEDLDKLLAGAKIQLVNTDPPYNVKVEPRSNNAIAAGLSSFQAQPTKADAIEASDAKGMHHQGFDLARDKSKSKGTTKKMRAKDRPLANDFVSDGDFDKMLMAWFGNIARVLEDGRSFYIWGGYANLGNYPGPLKACGLYFSQGIVWDKEHPVLTRKDFMGSFELAFYGWKEGAGHYFNPEINNARDLWHVKKVNPQNMVHLTEKPVELAVLAMTYSSKPNENVLDLFGGSGSTLMGAEKTGRHAYLMELDTAYCDVIRTRWANHVHGEGCDWETLTPEAE